MKAYSDFYAEFSDSDSEEGSGGDAGANSGEESDGNNGWGLRGYPGNEEDHFFDDLDRETKRPYGGHQDRTKVVDIRPVEWLVEKHDVLGELWKPQLILKHFSELRNWDHTF